MPADARVPLLVLGARTFAVEAADLIADTGGYELAGFVENLDRSRCGALLEGLPVFWVEDVAGMAASHRAVCALGSTARAALIEQAAGMGFRFATIVHPTARVSTKAVIGEGSIVSAGVVVAVKARVGRHVLLNRGALIGHNAEIGDYATIGPGANIAGFTRTGERTCVGMSAVILEGISVGSRSLVSAGAVVTRDVGDRTQVAGAPALAVKTGIDGL